jgi:hypothetical protein
MDDLELYWNNSWQRDEQHRHATLLRELKVELRQVRRQSEPASPTTAPREIALVASDRVPSRRGRRAVPVRR